MNDLTIFPADIAEMSETRSEERRCRPSRSVKSTKTSTRHSTG